MVLTAIEKGDIRIYPNPANDIITVKISSANSKAYFDIYNSTMQLVKSLSAESGIENKVSTHDLAPGIYFLIATTETGTYKQKFVIAR